MGFEPTNGGFADLSLGPLGYRAEPLSIANLLDLSGHLRATLLRRRLLFLPDCGNLCFAQEPRRFFRRCWIDVKARAPFKTGHFGQLRNDLDMPVIVIVDLITLLVKGINWRRGRDSNPRMMVLQTIPLGHLGTAPLFCYAQILCPIVCPSRPFSAYLPLFKSS